MKVVLLVVMLGAAMVKLFDAAPAAHAQSASLRNVDWPAILASEPGITVDFGLQPPTGFDSGLGPWINVKLAGTVMVPGLGGESGISDFGGFAVTAADAVLYGDIDGDGRDEAVIRTESTGTGGSFGFLLYREGSGRPRLIAAVPGYKQSVSISGRALVVGNPYYFGNEGNCCPTGLVRTRYQLSGDALMTVGASYFAYSTSGGNEREVTFRELVVLAHYRAIDQHRFEDAFRFLSSGQQAGHTVETWRQGYASTRKVEVTTSAGNADNEVKVDIVAEDDTPSGGVLVQRFTGSWFLVADSSVPWGYRLDRAVIREA